MSTWKDITLGEMCSLRAGSVFKTKFQGFKSGDFPFIKVSDMNLAGNELCIREANHWINNKVREAIKAKPFPMGTTVFAKIGEALKQNRVRYIVRPTLIDNNMMGAIPDLNLLDPRFFFYLLSTFDIAATATGTALPYLTVNTLERSQFSIPPLPTQRKIASILSAYDDLIENNQRRIKILEEMAQNLYREWFVKFRFPGHEKVKFVDSPLGRIPEGWEVSEFRNLFVIKYGKTLPKTKITETGPYPVYGAGDVIGRYDKILCKDKCVLVTSRGNGSGTVWRTREAAFITNNSLIITPKENFDFWHYSYVELLLKNSNVMEAKTGSAQPQITIENLNYVKAVVPKKEYVQSFCTFAMLLYEHVDLLVTKNATLRRTRDLLLPKLISGEIDVSDLDIAVPEEVEA